MAASTISSSVTQSGDEDDIDDGMESTANTVTVPLTVCLMIIIGYGNKVVRQIYKNNIFCLAIPKSILFREMCTAKL